MYLKSQILVIYFSIVFSTFWVSNIFVGAKIVPGRFFEEGFRCSDLLLVCSSVLVPVFS